MSLETSLTQLLKIKYPIVQAPIGSASSPALAAAVSNAGGLGMLALSWKSVDEVKKAIHETRKFTDRPFGVNLVLEWPQEERFEVCLKEGVKIFSFFWGDSTPYVKKARQAGALIMQTIGDSLEAKSTKAIGVDVIVAQGWEAGGHVWGEVATMPLIPSVVDVVSPCPVVAAGGIADGRGIAAALMLGASGVWLGTRFLASEEALAHPLYKQKILEAQESDTLYSCIFKKGWENAPHRTLKNSTTRGEIHKDAPIAHDAKGQPVFRYSDAIPLLGMTGDLEALALYAGQSSGLISEIKSAGKIVSDLVEETIQALKQAEKLIEIGQRERVKDEE